MASPAEKFHGVNHGEIPMGSWDIMGWYNPMGIPIYPIYPIFSHSADLMT